MMNIKNEISSAICDIHDLKKICKARNVLSARLEDGGLEPTVSDLIHDILYTLESLEYHKEKETFIDNFGEHDEAVSGDLVLVDAEKLDSITLSIGANESDFDDVVKVLPSKYYILRAINKGGR